MSHPTIHRIKHEIRLCEKKRREAGFTQKSHAMILVEDHDRLEAEREELWVEEHARKAKVEPKLAPMPDAFEEAIQAIASSNAQQPLIGVAFLIIKALRALDARLKALEERG